MKSFSIVLMLIGLSQVRLLAAISDPIVPSKLQSAIVYRNSAELIHFAKAGLHQGNNELIIGDISNNVDVNSIKIGCSGSVTIMSIAFSKEWLKPEFKSPMYKKMEDSINAVKKDLSKLSILIVSDHDLLDLLKANREMKGESTGLNVAELAKLVDYYKQKSLEIQNELNDCKEKVNKLTLILESLQRQLQEEERKNTKTSGRLALQLLSATEGVFDFTISYLTPTAYWNPCYDFRVDNINQPLNISYKAKLVQSSGIDWKQVKLTLSTAVPSQNNSAPQLKTWFLTYIDPVAQMNYSLKKGVASPQGRPAATQLNEVVASGYGLRNQDKSTSDDNGNNEPLYIVNGKQMSFLEFGKIDQRAIKKMESLKGANATAIYGSAASNGAVIVTLKDELGDYVSINDNELNITFDIDIPYDVKSDGREQNVVLKEYHIPVVFDYYSVPKLDASAYLLAEVPGWEKLNLLPGEANIIFEGTYVGKSFIDPNSTEDSLNLTMGRDKRVIIKKEKLKDFGSIKFLGTNKKQVFAYEITAKNNKKEKVQLKLADQFPISSNKDIEVELLETSGALVNNETGNLSWQMVLSPGETKKLRISYSIKFPKDRIVNVN